MNSSQPPATVTHGGPSRGRFMIVAVAGMSALLMYLDRVCISIMGAYIPIDLGLSERQWSFALGAFFFAYAIGQVPAGRLADQFGPRRMLALNILAWSACTAATGLANGFFLLLLARLACGLTQAGGYPSSAILLGNWFPRSERARANSVVTLGGRLGAVVAPWMTALLIIAFSVKSADNTIPVHNAGWRPVLWLYGALGIIVAVLSWTLIRERPDRPVEMLASSNNTARSAAGSEATATVLRRLVLSRNLWLCGTYQWSINLAWIFLITLLPNYLSETFDVPLEERGRMVAVPTFAGCFGMVAGGFLSDRLVRAIGLRWGRALPIALPQFLAAAALIACPWLPSAWAVVAALAAMAAMVDIAVPSVWAFFQDIGGRDVGAALGFSNMCGNLGAALSPVVLSLAKQAGGWNAAFATCSLAFLLAGFLGLAMNAAKPIHAEQATL